ncbi:MAG: hypothetical protein FWC70_03530 [Defluviitaleaceae bacterium]|nr:hypothetical protein [Defluviitaleaceae bacterium]
MKLFKHDFKQDLKRKLSLFMALTMVFGLLAPFAITPVRVYANRIPLPPPTQNEGTAFDGGLRVSFDAWMSPASGRPDFDSGMFRTPEGGAFATWPVAVNALGPGFLDVLRFFDRYGNRHELTVSQLHAHTDDGVGLQVSYDIFVPRRDAAGAIDGYVHINDPIRRVPGPNQGPPGGFTIWTAGVNEYASAYRFFTQLNGNAGVEDTQGFTRLNRVNDRRRFDDVPGGAYTPVRANYFDRTSNWNSGVPYPNPNFDPADPVSPDNPEMIPYRSYLDMSRLDLTAPDLYTTAEINSLQQNHYTWLSPSFNIADGRGYSFQFGGRSLHFRWEAGQFYFFVEDFLETGHIYEFVLERYASSALGREYVTGEQFYPAIGTPAPNRMVLADDRPAHSSNVVYVFPGIDFSTVNAIPFAHNLHVPGVPNTRAGRLTGYDTYPGGLVNSPTVDFSPLNLTANPPAQIVQQDLGLDIRFNLPSMHNEAEGNFTRDLMTHPLASQLGVAMITTVVGGGAETRTTEDFDVRIPLMQGGAAIPEHVPGTNNPLAGRAHLSVIDNVDGNPDIALRDVSLLQRTGTDHADRMRIKVGGLQPSIAYENVTLFLTTAPPPDSPGQILPPPANFLMNPARLAGTHDNPFYTFMEMRFDRLLGRQVVVATPFNLRVSPPGVVRAAYYHLEIDGLGRTSEEISEAAREVFFTLPEGFDFPLGFTVSRSLHSLEVGTPNRQFSQDVIWSPTRDPNIDLPHSFRVSDVLHRPMRADPDAGHLYYTVQWSIAEYRDLMALFGRPDGQFGSPGDVLRLSYVIGHSTSPETQAMIPGGDNAHSPYLRVDMYIRMNNNRLEVMYRSSSDFVDPPRYLGTPPGTPPYSPHPIFHCDTTFNPDGSYRFRRDEWVPLKSRMDMELGREAFFVDLRVHTNTARRFRYPPPPDELRDDFQFPGIYFLNVRLENWGMQGVDANRGGESPWSLFDDMVINDFGTLDPPPPENITVSAGPGVGEPATPPFLDVSFDIPASAILAYLHTLYPMETQITTNIYVGTFHEALLDAYFPYPNLPLGDPLRARQPLDPELRDSRAAMSVSFDDPRLGAEFIAGRTHFDLSADVFQNILRGASPGAHPSGIIRITDIPLIHHAPITTTPAGITFTFAPGDAVNYAHAPAGLTQEMSFCETYRILNQPNPFPMHLRINGLEENVAFFMFSDLEIAKYVECEITGNIIRRGVDDPAVSELTGVVTDTTVGSPDEPGIGDVGPSAPENLHVYEFDQTMAAIRWDPYLLTLDEQEEGIEIEWEIIRIQDGERMTTAQMNTRNANFAEVFAGMALLSTGQSLGWITDGTSITVLPGGNVHEEHCDDFEYRRAIVELRDLTLHPNSMYFYYVRTVRIERAWDDQLMAWVMVRSVSTWVEVSVTTRPIQPPERLRQEDPLERDDFDGHTMAVVSWEHEIMDRILENMGTLFEFRYQIRRSEEQWGEIQTVPAARMVEAMLDANRRAGGAENRIHYIVTGLEPSTMYEMRVQLVQILNRDGTIRRDASTWSNVLIIVTEIDPEDPIRDGEIDDWLNYLRRRLEELLRRPFWIANRTPDSATVVIRPDDVFRGLMDETVGTDIRLYNPGTDRVIYYIPMSSLFTANEERYGFSTAWDDIEFLFAPSFLTDVDNQAIIDMIRAIDARGSDVTDAFLRLEFNRTALNEINNRPAITPRTQLAASMVGTNDEIRSVAAWDRNMHRAASAIVDEWLNSEVMRENIRVQLLEELSNEEMSDHLYEFVDRIWQEVTDITTNYMRTSGGRSSAMTVASRNRTDRNGILHDTDRFPITEFDAAMHVVATPPRDSYSVFGYEHFNNAWRQQNLTEHHNGRAMIFRRPGIFGFTGREIIIPDIEITPRGDTVVSIVARYGLEDLFGVNVDLQQFANRQMVIGSIARTAGVPAHANAMDWAAANLDVQITSRNAAGLISRQEAIAVTVALYTHRTNTPIDTLRVHNHQHTAGMNLDPRFAPSVRAAFELGIIPDAEFDPAGPITIGEFLDMLTLLDARIRV